MMSVAFPIRVRQEHSRYFRRLEAPRGRTMAKNRDSGRHDSTRRPWHGRLMWLSTRHSPDKRGKGPYTPSLTDRLPHVAVLIGMIAALVGAGHLAAWLGGYLSQRGLSTITMKTNAALCLTLVGVALILLAPVEAGATRRWTARAFAALALVLGFLTFVENLAGWNFGLIRFKRTSP